MPDHDLQGMKVAMLSLDMFEEKELTEPRRVLDEAGAVTTLISTEAGQLQGANHDEKTITVPVDKTFDEVSPNNFDALLLPGGTMNADLLRIEEPAQEFAKAIDGAGKPIAVICHGPWLLVSSGLVGGRTLTSWPTLKDDIRNAGGKWEDAEVIVDHNWVSSRKPDDLPAFNREMLALFAEQKVTA